MKTVDVKLGAELQVLRLEPGDRLIVSLNREDWTFRDFENAYEQMRETFKQAFPDHEVVFLYGITLGVEKA